MVGTIPATPGAHGGTGVAAPRVDLATPVRVLLAEDNPTNRKLAVCLLEKLGCQVTTAANGALALEAATTESFDLVLMDMQMPVMDGIEATRRIRASEAPRRRRVPIVALTANAMNGDADTCRAAGMDEFLTKPIERASLNDLIDRIRGRLRGTEDGGGAAAPGPHHDVADVDLPALVAQLGGDAELLAEVVEIFRTTWEGSLDDIVAAATSGVAASVADAVHFLKGTARSLHARHLEALTSGIEDAARRGDVAPARDGLPGLRQALERLDVALAEPAETLLARAR